MLSVRVDTFPLVVTTFDESFSEADFDVFRLTYEEILERDEPYVSLIDTSQLVTVPSIGLRDEILAFSRMNADAMAHRCLSTEVVVKSIAVRTALSAVQWFSPTASRVSLHASLRPAVSRALDVVWTNQLTTSDALLAYHDESQRSVSIPPERPSGQFARRSLSSGIEGLLRKVRKSDRQS